MAKKLSKYREKRDPTRTNEPFAAAEPMRSEGTLVGSYVVHLHDATRRHYDLRIEVGGLLKSFAVPRGPSLDPNEKRLAVNTEDHPFEYLDFEAVIPEGNYGAGSMILWDRGAVRYLEGTAEEGIERGKIDFTLHGYKLKGRFALVKTSGRKGQPEPAQPQWLLIKKRDLHAREGSDILEDAPWSVLSGLTVEELPNAQAMADAIEEEATALGARALTSKPQTWTPMVCATTGIELHQPGWLYELKLDGVRILASRDLQDVSLRYRTSRSATHSYPEVARAMRALSPDHLVLDGEIVAFDEQGRPDFQRLSRRIHATRLHEAQQCAREVPVTYLVFDLLAIGERDLRGLPLTERKRLLRSVVPGKGLIRALDHLEDDGRPLWEFCKAQGLEGVIAKRADSRYVVGPRQTGDWVKLKHDKDDDFVVLGYTRGSGGRTAFGALELGSYVDTRLVYRGRVGSGFDSQTIDALLAQLEPLVIEKLQFEGELPPTPQGRSFVEPTLVARVRYSGWTHEGHLRHPVFEGVRQDVAPRDCHAAPLDERIDSVLEKADREHQSRADYSVGRVHLTNQDKVFWPDEGYTKGDLCTYYDAIAETVLPYLHDRPVLMVRYPDGIAGKNFYQWNVPQGTPDWVRAFPIRSEEHDGREVMSFLVNDRDTLLHIANLGCIPLHILASRAHDLERCDFLTIDFDVGEADFSHAIELARGLRALLDEIGLPGYPKTSGQSGLHVLVALGGVPFPAAKALTELLGRILHGRFPEISTIERMRRNRPKAVYIDTGQTGRSRSIVAPYSVRATAGARVSTPLSWDEVAFSLDLSTLNIFTVPERVARYGDPMAGMLDQTPDVAAAVGALGKLLGS